MQEPGQLQWITLLYNNPLLEPIKHPALRASPTNDTIKKGICEGRQVNLASCNFTQFPVQQPGRP